MNTTTCELRKYETRADLCKTQGALIESLLGRLRHWQQNRRTRQQLAGLSDYQLRDIGVSRTEAEEEVRRDGLPVTEDGLRQLKMMGFTDARLAGLTGRT